MKSTSALCLAIGTALCTGACSNGPSSEAIRELAALESQIAALEQRKSLIEDANDIKRLQRAYGYYIDEAQWEEVADLFA